jgi:short-subunit dehydrogenase
MSLDRTEPERRETALVTGASEGIGYELAKLFARDGYDLVLVARNEIKLNQIADDLSRAHGIAAKVIVKDLSHSDAPGEIHDELEKDSIKIDVLVNNAGVGIHGLFAKTDLSQECDMLQVLILAPTKLTKLFLKDMLENGGGKILNVSSSAAYAPVPFESVYASAKAYILHFSEAIAEELAGSNVTVTVLCPGPTRTQMPVKMNIEDKLAFKYGTMSAEKVAEIGYGALMDNKRCVVPGIHNKAMVFSRRLMPPGLGMKIVRFVASK